MNQTQSRFAIALKDPPLLFGIEKIKGADFFISGNHWRCAKNSVRSGADDRLQCQVGRRAVRNELADDLVALCAVCSAGRGRALAELCSRGGYRNRNRNTSRLDRFFIGGGGGNRTPVRRFSVKYDYMLSRCFDLAPQAPSGWVSRNYPVWISASSPPAEESAHPTE